MTIKQKQGVVYMKLTIKEKIALLELLNSEIESLRNDLQYCMVDEYDEEGNLIEKRPPKLEEEDYLYFRYIARLRLIEHLEDYAQRA